MNKLNPIKYIENMLSHHPKSISLWITEGIVINGERYIIKEFRLRDGSLYAVIAENKYTPKYFEVKLAPDEETLKDIYQAIKENKIAIEKEVTDRKNEINRVDSKVTELQGNIKPIVSDNTELLTVTKEESQIKLTPFHDVQKEQVLESTRNTVNIQHGSNGTTEETTVDTNPQKVLEHENLVSDSEYVTINHQTGENTTHIQAVKLKEKLDDLQQNKQDTLVAGNGITIQGNTISATGGGGEQNTENYYICLPDVSGVVTLTKFENDIVLPYDRVKGVLEYSIYLYFEPSEQGYAGKPIEGPIKNIADADHGEGGIYTDVTNPTIFSGLYEVYPTAGIGSPDHDSGNFIFYYDGDSLSVTCDTRKAPPGHVYNITGKTLLVEKIEHGGGGSGNPTVNAV